MIPPDVENHVRRQFNDEADDILAKLDSLTLDRCTDETRTRVLRCIVYLGGYKKPYLLSLINTAERDYRDVIYWAEYDEEGRKQNDFHEPLN